VGYWEAPRKLGHLVVHIRGDLPLDMEAKYLHRMNLKILM
jgi:hypothetical protein